MPKYPVNLSDLDSPASTNVLVTATAATTTPPSPSPALPDSASNPPFGCPLFDYTNASSEINGFNNLQNTTKCQN